MYGVIAMPGWRTVCFFLAALMLAAGASARDLKKTIRFEKGMTSATVSGAVVRGDRDVYTLGARAGQSMEVSVKALEDNAAFTLKGPDGKYLPGAADGDDATSFKGSLPLSGTYLLEVGGTRGNAEYTLTVAIH